MANLNFMEALEEAFAPVLHGTIRHSVAIWKFHYGNLRAHTYTEALHSSMYIYAYPTAHSNVLKLCVVLLLHSNAHIMINCLLNAEGTGGQSDRVDGNMTGISSWVEHQPVY